MSEYKVRTVQFSIVSIYTVETDLATSDKEAIEIIRQEINDGNHFEDEREYKGWDLLSVKIARD